MSESSWQRKARESAAERYERMSADERGLQAQGYRFIAGIDEAGRGPLAGPVAAAACILDPGRPIFGLNDSKKLSPAKRETLYDEIMSKALATGVCLIPASVIDSDGINPAIFRAMREAIARLEVSADFLLLDYVVWQPELPHRILVKGDAKVNAIAAASILAKVTRDRYMERLAQTWPDYGFEHNKGYGSAAHIAALKQRGPCPEHRRSYLKRIL